MTQPLPGMVNVTVIPVSKVGTEIWGRAALRCALNDERSADARDRRNERFREGNGPAGGPRQEPRLAHEGDERRPPRAWE